MKFKFLLLFSTIVNLLVGQTPNYFIKTAKDSTMDYFSINDSLTSFFDSNDSLKQSNKVGYKDFIRYKNFMESRVDSNGELANYIIDYNIENYNHIQNLGTSNKTGSLPGCFSDFISNWKPLGFSERPGYLYDDNSNGMGWLSSIWVNPNNYDHIRVGANRGGLWETTDGGQNWNCISKDKFDGMGINYIAVNPSNTNIIYVAPTFSEKPGLGIWKTTDGGSTWDMVPGFKKSPFTLSDPYEQYGYFHFIKILIHPTQTNTLFALYNNRVLKTTDGGSTWSELFPAPNEDFTDIEFHGVDAGTGNLILWLIGHKLYKSVDLGSSYSAVNTNYQPNTSTVTVEHANSRIAVSDLYPNLIYLHYESHEKDAAGNILYFYSVIEKSTDNGSTWTVQRQKQITFNNNGTFPDNYYELLATRKWGFEISTIDPKRVHFGGNHFHLYDDDNPLTSINQYVTNKAGIHDDVRDLVVVNIDANKEIVFIAGDGGIEKAIYDKTNPTNWVWIDINGKGLQVQQIDAISKSNSLPSRIMTGHQDLGMIEFNGVSKKWTHYFRGDGGTSIYDPSDETKFLYINGLPYSYNRFNISKSLPYIEPGTPRARFNFFKTTKNLYYTAFVNGCSKIIKINDYFSPSTSTTTVLSANLPCVGIISAYCVSATEDTIFVAFNNILKASSSNNSLYRSTDGGNTWVGASTFNTNYSNLKELLTKTYISDIIFNPSNSKEIWIGFTYNSNISYKSELYRVFRSTNTGQTFGAAVVNTTSVPDATMRSLPVNRLVFDEQSTNRMIYAATDNGVYYTNDDVNEWVRFSDGLPFGIVSDIIIDRKELRLVASTYGRGTWYTDIPCCDETASSASITTNTTWDSEKSINTVITVQSGAILTIKDATYYFKPNSKIIVKPGGKLVVSNALLTSYCASLWGGIVVEGQGNLSDNYNNQGWAVIQNSTIQYAYRGVFCGDENDFSKGGGILQSDNNVFKDCRVGIDFYPYPDPYLPTPPAYTSLSRILNCQFLWTQTLPDPSGKGMLHGVAIWRINGVRLEGNKFVNSTPEFINGELTFSDNFRGNGIFGHDASFIVDRLTYSSDPCHAPAQENHLFEGLSNGVVLLNTTNPDARNAVITSTFKNCQNGISAIGDLYTKHFKNSFTWDKDFVSDDNSANSFGYFDALGIGQVDPYVTAIIHNGSDGFLTEGNQVTYEEGIDRAKKYNAFAFNNVVGVGEDYAVKNSVINNIDPMNLTPEPFIIGKSVLDNCADLLMYCNEYCNLKVDWYWYNTNLNHITAQTLGTNNFSDPQSSRNTFNVNYYKGTVPGIKSVGFKPGSLYTLPSSCTYTPPATTSLYNVTTSTISPVTIAGSCLYANETNLCAIYKPDQVLPGDEYDGEIGMGGFQEMVVRESTKDETESLKKDIVELINSKQYSEALKKLSTLSEDSQENIDFKTFYLTVIHEFKAGNSLNKISNEGLIALRGLAKNTTVSGAKAKTLLLGLYGEIIPTKGYLLDDPHRDVNDQGLVSNPISSFKVYPNPTSKYINIEYLIQENEMPARIEIVNSLGVILYSENIKSPQGKTTLYSDSWSDGVYLINIKTQNKVLYTQKVIKLTH